jgi:hypothetical protein
MRKVQKPHEKSTKRPKLDQESSERACKKHVKRASNKWNVEKILSSIKVDGDTYLMVKWDGYDEETLEPLANLEEDVPNMVKKFQKQQEKVNK